MLHRPKMKIWVTILLCSAVSINCTVGNEENFNLPDLTCSKPGNFPVTGSCHEYYACREWKGGYYPVPATCLPGNIFDDIFAECKPKNDVTSPAHCLNNTPAPPPEAAVVNAPPEGVVGPPAVVVVVEAANGNSPDTVVVEAANGNSPDTVVVEAANGNSPGTVGVFDVDVSEQEASDNNQTTVKDERVFVNITFQGETFAVPAFSGGNVTVDNTMVEAAVVNAPHGVVGPPAVVVDNVNVTLGNGTVDGRDTETVVPGEGMSICVHMSIVNIYANLVIITPSLRESFKYLEKYNKHVMKYNGHLENAQNDSFIWRNGESILDGIRKTYSLASAYEREFSTKYKICQDRLKTVSKQNHTAMFLQMLKDDIRKLEEDIPTIEGIMLQTSLPQLKEYFENDIESKRQEIARKQKEIQTHTKVGLQLNELLQFLYYVKEEANKVENLAKHSKEKMEMFRENLHAEYAAFERFATMASEDIQVLSEEKEQYQISLKANEAEQLRLENKKETLNADIDGYNEDIDKNTNTIRKITNKMEQKLNIFNLKRDAYCKTIDFSVNATDIERARECNALLEVYNITLDLSKDRKKKEKLSENSEKIRKQILDILDEFTVMDQEMRNLLSAVPTYAWRIQQINVELGSLQKYYRALESLHFGITSSIDSIMNIMREFQDMQAKFESITEQLNAMIAKGNAVENEDDTRQAKLAIEEHISDVQGQLQELLLPQLEKCT